MNEVDKMRAEELKRQRKAAEDVLKDATSDQVSRDLAHLCLNHEEGTKGVGGSISGDHDAFMKQEGMMAVEAYEDGSVDMSDQAVVAYVEDALLRNKWKAIRTVRGFNGKTSVVLAYPRLMNAVQNQFGNGRSQEEKASAYAVMACMTRPTDYAACLKYFKQAIKLRPKDWRLHNAVSSAYMSLSKISLSLESLNRAAELTGEKSIDRFEVESCRGKVLFNLQRNKEAKAVFVKTLADAKGYGKELNLCPLDHAHLIVTEYMLTSIWLQEHNEKMTKHQWNSAETKRKDLSPDILQRIDWDSRLSTATLIRMVYPSILSHQECHYCHQLCLDPNKCGACKEALYCNRSCQKAHWKAGHKQQCQTAKITRKTKEEEIKKNVQKQKAVANLPPLDASLDPLSLWAKAKKLSKDPSKALDSVFLFALALFLDFGLDGENMEAVTVALKGCDSRHPLALALRMVPKINNKQSNGELLSYMEDNNSSAFKYLDSHNTTPANDYPKTFEQLDRAQFGCAMCMIFRARMIGRCFKVTSLEQAQSDQFKDAYDVILLLIRDVEIFLPNERWLTLQFEFGYSNFDVGAADEAARWLKKFLDNVASMEKNNGDKLTKHWKKIRKSARTKLQIVPHIQRAHKNGLG